MKPVTIERRQLLAHRGCWTDALGNVVHEKNSLVSIDRARDLGFGLETDLRDRLGQIVISHDPADSLSPTTDLSNFRGFNAPVALNIKSDGLAGTLAPYMSNLGSGSEVFFFDMSTPETIQYKRQGLQVANRLSEYESLADENPAWIWLDCFKSDWYLDVLGQLLAAKPDAKICIVSPELHKRDYEATWEKLAPQMSVNPNLFLCTDLPEMFIERWG